ncbi:MAG: DNA N-6-adenine-methyltransferase [Nanoarchaeota archaeon]|nr:DNA N-6-adenine-methyltransferase [Nanoarchaeota archaeon]
MTAGRKINTISQEWGTPEKYVSAVKDFFGGKIDLDPCSNNYSIVNAVTEYKLPKQNGLIESWKYSTIYINPPYGIDKTNKTSIRNWLFKCADAHQRFNAEILALIPVATNTGHWKNFVFGKASSICFLYDTRLKFLVNGRPGGKGAPMACAMAYWGNNHNKFYDIFSKFEAVIDIRNIKGKEFGKLSNEIQKEIY